MSGGDCSRLLLCGIGQIDAHPELGHSIQTALIASMETLGRLLDVVAKTYLEPVLEFLHRSDPLCKASQKAKCFEPVEESLSQERIDGSTVLKIVMQPIIHCSSL
jgi:hypothetical protein